MPLVKRRFHTYRRFNAELPDIGDIKPLKKDGVWRYVYGL